MQSQKIEEDVRKLVENFSQEDFIYDFLLAFGFTKMSIKRLREGNSNLSKKENQLIIKQKLFYEFSADGDIYSIIDDLKKDSATYTHKPRFIIVNNAKELLAIDTKTQETLTVELAELYKNIDFFLPWTGKEKYVAHQENPADVKAAENMARIYDEIIRLNPELTHKDKNHSLNIFLTRLLFCFFAEDTGIFEGNIFTKTVNDHTNDDGSDLANILAMLFESLDKKDSEKGSYPSFIQEFPYVNGKLFTDKVEIPKLNSKVKKLILECGGRDWKEINPDIFGSMFQAVSVAEVRSGLGQHYTSVPNIMKVIEPLFLNDLREEFEKAETDKKLRKLLDRIYNLKIFDPACGSGNFLIIAYKQLRLLEMEIIKKIHTLPGQHPFMMSQIQLNQFYGIEIDDFACEIARLSLWLAEHQMNRKFKDEFGDCKPPLPLSMSGNIVCGNATRLDWEKVCPKVSPKELNLQEACEKARWESMPLALPYPDKKEFEIYILGNPPYLGSRNQKVSHKSDIQLVFNNFNSYKNLDYISCWFYKAKKYIEHSNAMFAFVTTNSICQGEQVGLLWPFLIDNLTEIGFAYQSFKWTNNAKNQAGVTCNIIGMRNVSARTKYIFTTSQIIDARNINAYLLDANNIYIQRAKKVLNNLPAMSYGNYTGGCPDLMLSQDEMNDLITKDIRIKEFIRPLSGSKEFINNIPRYCLWIMDNKLDSAKQIPLINQRINKVKATRLEADDVCIQKLASRPHQFRDLKESLSHSIIMPVVSSERREYIPCGFLDKDYILTNSAQAIYDAPSWVFGVVTSRMHMVWVRAVAGRLKTDYRYSAELCYNTFPFPDITDKQKKIIEMHVDNILAEREKHSDKTMAELYDPDKMPQGLRDAHHSLDLVIEKCYRQAPFESDEKRLEHLFKRYEIMTDPTKQANVEEQLSLL